MINSFPGGVRKQRWGALCLALLFGSAIQAAGADCPGHPDALGTSRTLVVDPREHPRIGIMQYGETLPLDDHEVVLTFDDGPLPRNSNEVLAILASQCVKATFFVVGRMANAYPDGIRKLNEAGHSIGTHSQNHPISMNRMPIERARQEIDEGISSVRSALGGDAAPAPFFRIPGLSRTEEVEEYLASLGIQVWSADFPADDWRHVSSSRVYDLAIKRLEQKRKGILLLHDIQPRTVAALPKILHQLKVRGYRIVHVVPATPEHPATQTQPEQWRLHAPSVTAMAVQWPKIPNFVFTDTSTLPAPAPFDLGWPQPTIRTEFFNRAKRIGRGVPLPREAPWPRYSPAALGSASPTLPVPAQSNFEIEQNLPALPRTLASPHRAEHTTITNSDEPAIQAHGQGGSIGHDL